MDLLGERQSQVIVLWFSGLRVGRVGRDMTRDSRGPSGRGIGKCRKAQRPRESLAQFTNFFLDFHRCVRLALIPNLRVGFALGDGFSVSRVILIAASPEVRNVAVWTRLRGVSAVRTTHWLCTIG